jgi:hypothetical protein
MKKKEQREVEEFYGFAQLHVVALLPFQFMIAIVIEAACRALKLVKILTQQSVNFFAFSAFPNSYRALVISRLPRKFVHISRFDDAFTRTKTYSNKGRR